MDILEILHTIAGEFCFPYNTVEIDEAEMRLHAYVETRNHKKMRIQISVQKDEYGRIGFISEVIYKSFIAGSSLITYHKYTGEIDKETIYADGIKNIEDHRRYSRQAAEILNWAEIAIENAVVSN